jgi:hypothetical protein
VRLRAKFAPIGGIEAFVRFRLRGIARFAGRINHLENSFFLILRAMPGFLDGVAERKPKTAVVLHCTCAQMFGRERQQALSRASLPGTDFPKPYKSGFPRSVLYSLGRSATT